jgi:hypothetical protein
MQTYEGIDGNSFVYSGFTENRGGLDYCLFAQKVVECGVDNCERIMPLSKVAFDHFKLSYRVDQIVRCLSKIKRLFVSRRSKEKALKKFILSNDPTIKFIIFLLRSPLNNSISFRFEYTLNCSKLKFVEFK